MKKILKQFGLIASAALLFTSAQAQTEKTVEVGGAAMYPSKNIVENAVNSKDHTTLVAAVKAAGLVETLQGEGPFTVFAPTNAAFDKLPQGTVATLLKPENKAMLASILTYHVVAGKIDSKTLLEWIKKSGGTYAAKTVQGGELKFSMMNGKIMLTDEKGGMAHVTINDVYQKNGVIHVIDTVVMPK
ncbi:fasciclin domain-containing protein [soil metagenome]